MLFRTGLKQSSFQTQLNTANLVKVIKPRYPWNHIMLKKLLQLISKLSYGTQGFLMLSYNSWQWFHAEAHLVSNYLINQTYTGKVALVTCNTLNKSFCLNLPIWQFISSGAFAKTLTANVTALSYQSSSDLQLRWCDSLTSNCVNFGYAPSLTSLKFSAEIIYEAPISVYAPATSIDFLPALNYLFEPFGLTTYREITAIPNYYTQIVLYAMCAPLMLLAVRLAYKYRNFLTKARREDFWKNFVADNIYDASFNALESSWMQMVPLTVLFSIEGHNPNLYFKRAYHKPETENVFVNSRQEVLVSAGGNQYKLPPRILQDEKFKYLTANNSLDQLVRNFATEMKGWSPAKGLCIQTTENKMKTNHTVNNLRSLVFPFINYQIKLVHLLTEELPRQGLYARDLSPIILQYLISLLPTQPLKPTQNVPGNITENKLSTDNRQDEEKKHDEHDEKYHDVTLYIPEKSIHSSYEKPQQSSRLICTFIKRSLLCLKAANQRHIHPVNIFHGNPYQMKVKETSRGRGRNMPLRVVYLPNPANISETMNYRFWRSLNQSLHLLLCGAQWGLGWMLLQSCIFASRQAGYVSLKPWDHTALASAQANLYDPDIYGMSYLPGIYFLCLLTFAFMSILNAFIMSRMLIIYQQKKYSVYELLHSIREYRAMRWKNILLTSFLFGIPIAMWFSLQSVTHHTMRYTQRETAACFFTLYRKGYDVLLGNLINNGPYIDPPCSFIAPNWALSLSEYKIPLFVITILIYPIAAMLGYTSVYLFNAASSMTDNNAKKHNYSRLRLKISNLRSPDWMSWWRGSSTQPRNIRLSSITTGDNRPLLPVTTATQGYGSLTYRQAAIDS